MSIQSVNERVSWVIAPVTQLHGHPFDCSSVRNSILKQETDSEKQWMSELRSKCMYSTASAPLVMVVVGGKCIHNYN